MWRKRVERRQFAGAYGLARQDWPRWRAGRGRGGRKVGGGREGSRQSRLPNKNGAARAPFSQKHSAILLDLGFTEFHVLARNRVVLLLHELVGHGARILLGDVVEAGVRRGNELDLNGDRFGHDGSLKNWEIWRRPTGPHSAGNLPANRHKSRFSGPNPFQKPGI